MSETKALEAAWSAEYDGERLPPYLERAQVNAAEPTPAVLPLLRQPVTSDGHDPGPPKPQIVPATPVPRLVHQNARAPQGVKRYKVRCDNYPAQPIRYVLAKAEREAATYYVKATGLQALIEAAGAAAPQPRLSIKELPD